MEGLLEVNRDLEELEGAISEALDAVHEWLNIATVHAEDMAEACGGQIEGMNLLVERLATIQREMKEIVPESIKERIAAEKIIQEELRDQWDAQSY